MLWFRLGEGYSYSKGNSLVTLSYLVYGSVHEKVNVQVFADPQVVQQI